jgi:hypothetical protein
MMVGKVEESKKTYRVPAENIDALNEQIASVNKRVARLVKKGHDVSPVVIVVGPCYTVVVEGKGERVYADVELASPAPPKVDGWEFVAALTHVADVGTVMRVCPGVTVTEGELKRYREASPENCDHCQTARKRNDTFVIRNREGQLNQVGRQCLAAYTGLGDPDRLCSAAELLFSASELLESAEDDGFGGFGGAGGERFVSIATYLPYVACSIREDGWLSRSKAYEQGMMGQSTSDLAFSCGVYARPTDKKRYVPTEKDFNLAAATIEFCEDRFAGCDVDSLTDYENSLRVAMSSGVAHPKFKGLIASAVTFYQRDVEKRARAEVWGDIIKNSRFQGVVKERRIFEGLKVLAYRVFANDFGSTHFYSFVDGAGNAFAYFATRDMDLSVGQLVSFNATVKKHERRPLKIQTLDKHDYEQTVLTRCSLVARARVVSQDLVERAVGLKVTNPDQLKFGVFATYQHEMVKHYAYHLVGTDGRKFVFVTKSRKKTLIVGKTVMVGYEGNVEIQEGDELPVSLVSSEAV